MACVMYIFINNYVSEYNVAFLLQIHSTHSGDRQERTAAFFHEVCRRTARLVALWQSVGFCHGYVGNSGPNQHKKMTTPSDLDENGCVGNLW